MIAFLCALCITMPAMAAEPKIEDLAWLAGAWSAGDFEEHWVGPRGGTMQMVGRAFRDGKTSFMEFGSIETGEGGSLTLWMIVGAPSLGRKEPEAFLLARLDEKGVVFERGGEDFPQRIAYHRISDDEMRVTLEGGRPPVKYAFRRIK